MTKNTCGATAKNNNSEKDNLSFEEALYKLEDIVKKLEEGNLPLDKTLQEFELGISLYKKCQKQLEAAERKVEILLKDESGNYRKEPLSPVVRPLEVENKSTDLENEK